MLERWKQWQRRNPLWRSYRVSTLLLRTLYTINRERSRVVRARARGDYEAHPDLDALVRILRDFRLTAVELGGLLIKLGQFLGARADLLPQAALNELAALHDEVPPERFEDITAVLERAWRAPVNKVCAVIEPQPAGSASLGQVHEAWLVDGAHVAIKVQRPGITGIVRTDLRCLRFVLWVVGRLVPAANRITDLQALYREFSRTVAEELNYEQEARHAVRFARVFADDPTIQVPAVLPTYSTRRVLVLEWMDGIKITDFAALDAAGVDRDQLAKHLASAYLTQILTAGYFHADPHPGNLLVQPDGDGERIVFLDFGMMGTITPRMRTGLQECFRGAVMRDAARLVRGLDLLGFFADHADRAALERLVAAMLQRFGGAPVRQLRATDPREVLGDVEMSLYDQPIRLPAEFAFFGRMAGMLLGLMVGLSPRFNFIEVATPYAQQFLRRDGLDGVLSLLGAESLEGLGRDLLRSSLATVRSLAELPQRLDRVLERAERGDLHLVIQNTDPSPTDRAQAGKRASRRGLNRPVPLWMPLSLLGLGALTWLIQRRPPSSR
jgi:predicted unusual protein kinase regulating ubiquinone biosynthesis (AarF/ABC1/UbiB family)